MYPGWTPPLYSNRTHYSTLVAHQVEEHLWKWKQCNAININKAPWKCSEKVFFFSFVYFTDSFTDLRFVLFSILVFFTSTSPRNSNRLSEGRKEINKLPPNNGKLTWKSCKIIAFSWECWAKLSRNESKFERAVSRGNRGNRGSRGSSIAWQVWYVCGICVYMWICFHIKKGSIMEKERESVGWVKGKCRAVEFSGMSIVGGRWLPALKFRAVLMI